MAHPVWKSSDIEAPIGPTSAAIKLGAVVATLLAFSSGCATVMSGTSEHIRFESMPSGAEVTIDGEAHTTPARVKLSRRQNHEVTFNMPGYLSVQRQVLQSTNPWLFGNILLGGLIGIIVDTSSGASNDLKPDLVYVKLVPDQPVKEEDVPGLQEPTAEQPADDGKEDTHPTDLRWKKGDTH